MLLIIAEYSIYFLLIGPLLFYLFYRNPYYCLYFFIIWLPLQTFLISLMALNSFFSNQLILFLFSLKELSLLLLFITLLIKGLIFKGKIRFIDYLFIINILLVLVYFVLPDSLMGATSDIRERLFGLRFSVISSLIYLSGRSIPYDKRAVLKGIRLLQIICLIIILFGFVEFVFIPRDILVSGLMRYIAIKNNTPELISAEPGEMLYIVNFGGFTIKRIMSFFLSPLSIAYFLILPFSLFLSGQLGISEKRNSVLTYSLPILILISITMLLSNTRAVIAACSFIVVIFYSGKHWIKALFFSGIIALFLSVTFLKSVIVETVNLEDPSAAAHAYAYVIGFENIISHPFGIGLGKAGPVAGQTGAVGIYGGNDATVGESLYLSMAVEKGIFSVILFLLFAVSIAIAGRKLSTSTFVDPVIKLIGKTVLIATICFIIASVSTEHWLGFQSSAIYWWFAGLAVQLNNQLKYKTVNYDRK